MFHRPRPLLRRCPRFRQRTFRFVERGERLARRFKLGIAAFTACVFIAPLAGTSAGRFAAAWTWAKLQRGMAALAGDPDDRRWIDAEWRRRRLFDVEQARTKLLTAYGSYDAKLGKLLDAAGLDPDHALLRWGNFSKALLLPSTIFEPDENGRSYRLRPNTRSIWVRNLRSKEGVLAYFPVPDDPEVLKLAEAAGIFVVRESVQSTNSWGLRGNEPNLSASLRGLVLGDSYMQGIFVPDDQTPSECLKRVLASHFDTSVEILNTGLMGYSPEQEYFTLIEFADRFRPRFVILGLFANDFGDLFEVLDGKADWDENRHWIGKISAFCRSRNLPLLVVPAPWVNHIEGPRRTAWYPGRIPELLDEDSTYFDPMEAFVEAYQDEKLRRTEPSIRSGLFNGHLGDGHFSPAGCQVWAEAVGKRLSLLMQLLDKVGAAGSKEDEGREVTHR